MSDTNPNISYKKCPYCAEEDLRMEAIVCKHCGRDLINNSYPLLSTQNIPNQHGKQNKWIFFVIMFIVLAAIPICIFSNSYVNRTISPTSVPVEIASKLTLAAMVETLQTTKEVIPTIPPLATLPQPVKNNELGVTRNNPIPMGTEKNIGYMSFVITGIIRPANEIVETGNMFNTKPEANQEYLMVEARTTCLKDPSEKCDFSPFEFKAVGSDGNVISVQYSVSGVPGQFDSGETFGGSAKAGRLFFLIPKSDPGVVIFYEARFGGTPTFFAIQ